jgi:hypothetical protein
MLKVTRRWQGGAVVAGLLLALTSPVWADGDPAKKADEDQAEALKISGEIKVRGEARRDASFGAGSSATGDFVGQLTRVSFAGEVKGARYRIEVIDGRDWGTERKTGTATSTALHQGYLEVGRRVTLRLGRQEVTWGQKRLIGSSGWAYKDLAAYDGARLLSSIGRGQVDAFALKIVEGAAAEADDTSLYGLAYTLKLAPWARPGFYALLQTVDDNPAVEGNDRTTMPIVGMIGTLGPGAGVTLDYEAIYEGGKRKGRDHSAYFAHAGLLYKERTKGRYWLGAEYNLASGDKDPTDADGGTFDKLYSINHSHYGIMDYQDPQNMRDIRLTAGARLASWASLECDYHKLGLVQAKDAWYSRSADVDLRDATGASGKDVGWEVDVVAKIDLPMSQKLEIGLASFSPGTFVRQTNGGHAESSQWGYVQVKAVF